MDELLPQEQIEQAADKFDIGEIETQKFNTLSERLKRIEIKFQANKIRRENKEYGRSR